MSNDLTPSESAAPASADLAHQAGATGSVSRDAVREKAAAVRTRQRRLRVVRTTAIVTVSLLVVGAIGTAIGWTFVSKLNEPTQTPLGLVNDAIVIDGVPSAYLASVVGAAGGPNETSLEQATAAPDDAGTAEDEALSANAGQAAIAGDAGEPAGAADPGVVRIDVYLDYLSPASAEFEAANAGQLARLVDEGAAQVSYRPVALLTGKSNGTKYSLRAAASSACVATWADEAFYPYHHELLAQQPEIDADGHSDKFLADLAVASGADNPKEVRRCIEEGDYISWAQEATDRALNTEISDGVSLTGPVVLVNDEVFVGDPQQPRELADFILSLSSKEYLDTTQTATPTPTPSG